MCLHNTVLLPPTVLSFSVSKTGEHPKLGELVFRPGKQLLCESVDSKEPKDSTLNLANGKSEPWSRDHGAVRFQQWKIEIPSAQVWEKPVSICEFPG
jgi:hypothetical protein